MGPYMCSLLVALEFFSVLQSVAGDTPYPNVAHVGQDGIEDCCSSAPSEHTESISPKAAAAFGFVIVGSFAIIIIYCLSCQHCLTKGIEEKFHRPTTQRASQQPIQLNVHNLQQPAARPAPAPVVRCPERSTAPMCTDADLPPPYEVAVACESYSLLIPHNSASK